MHEHHLHFKLIMRKFLMKHRDATAWKSAVLNNYRQIPLSLFDEVLKACVSEGTITVSEGKNGGQRLTWHDDKVTPTEVVS